MKKRKLLSQCALSLAFTMTLPATLGVPRARAGDQPDHLTRWDLTCAAEKQCLVLSSIYAEIEQEPGHPPRDGSGPSPSPSPNPSPRPTDNSGPSALFSSLQTYSSSLTSVHNSAISARSAQKGMQKDASWIDLDPKPSHPPDFPSPHDHGSGNHDSDHNDHNDGDSVQDDDHDMNHPGFISRLAVACEDQGLIYANGVNLLVTRENVILRGIPGPRPSLQIDRKRFKSGEKIPAQLFLPGPQPREIPLECQIKRRGNPTETPVNNPGSTPPPPDRPHSTESPNTAPHDSHGSSALSNIRSGLYGG